MELFFWVTDLLLPVILILLGIKYSKHPPKQINLLRGYRTSRSMKSQEAWDYANHTIGKHWIIVGTVLTVAIIVSKIVTPIEPEKLSLIHVSVELLSMILPVPFIEYQLNKKLKE